MPAALLPVALHVKACVSWRFKELDGGLNRSAGSSSQPSTFQGPFDKPSGEPLGQALYHPLPFTIVAKKCSSSKKI